MQPFHDHEYIFNQCSTEQLEFNPHFLPNRSYSPSSPTIACTDGVHDLLFTSDGITNNAAPTSDWPSLPLGDSATPTVRNIRNKSSSCQRATRKGRHSKIFTANGLRDRRMRLSIDVAQNFFQLQDMLGFDKASKTVQWLLTMSKAAIKELDTVSSSKICTSSNQSPKSESSDLACEDSSTLSGSKNKSSTVTATARQTKKTKAKKGATKPTRKAELHSAVAKELRTKARERARERTRGKQRMTSFSSSIPLDAIKEESSIHNLNALLEFDNKEEEESGVQNQCFNITSERAYQDPMIGESFMIPIFESNKASTAINDTGIIFEEHWEMESLSLYSRSLVAFNNCPN